MIYVWFTVRGIEQHRFVVCICISEYVLYLPVYGSGVSENGANGKPHNCHFEQENHDKLYKDFGAP